MHNLDKALEQQLQDWAEWYIKNRDGAGGYAQKTSYIKFDLMSLSRRHKRKPVEPVNHNTEDVMLWITYLFEWKPQLVQAICARYIGILITLENSKVYEQIAPFTKTSIIADKLNISERTLTDRIHNAKIFLAGCMIQTYLS